MTDRIPIPGGREVRASLDRPAEATGTLVVACPPHPQMGGDRRDGRLRAVSDALAAAGIGTLRFDYGAWDEGRGEVTDCRNALDWARQNADSVGLFGYSFGGAVALRAGAIESRAETPPVATSVLAPAGTLAGSSVASSVTDLSCPLQVVYGERDDTVDSSAIAQRARERGATVTPIPADHFLVGHRDTVAEEIAGFLASHLE